VEGGRVGLRGRDLRDLLDLYEVSDPRHREELENLAREGKQRGWWSRYSDKLPEPLIDFLGFEEAADSMNAYQDGVVPGLLQTERYCRALIQQGMTAALDDASPEDIELRVQVRMARQSHLEQRPRQLQFLIDERVFYRTIGGRDVLDEQLGHLLTALRKPYIQVQAIPFAHGDRIVVAGSFIIMRFPQDPEVVWVETPIGLDYEERDEAVRTYSRIFESLASVALDADMTEQLVREARNRLS
jgi:hypothetical protein